VSKTLQTCLNPGIDSWTNIEAVVYHIESDFDQKKENNYAVKNSSASRCQQ
jgi:hypothetical protein